MSASYISMRFEKNASLRCITRNLDDGGVPPAPSINYRPTSPDSLRECLVIEYVNDTLGERMSRVASLAEMTSLTARALDSFEVYGADFVGTGVVPGDVLQVFPVDNALWASEEYPASPFLFSVLSVPTAERLVLTSPLPSWLPLVSWQIAGKTSGSLNGYPRRSGFPAPGSTFRDSRMATFFTNAADLEAYVASTKSQLDALSATVTSSTLSSENYSTP